MPEIEWGAAGDAAVADLRGYVDFCGDGAEHRAQQEQMTALAADALSDGENLICQAGTGTGKSIGYINAVAATGKRTVVATATKALSEQLVRLDIPAYDAYLAAEGRHPLSYALLKGRNNYVCKLKLDGILRLGEQEEGTGAQQSLDFGDEFAERPLPDGPTVDADQEIEEYKSVLVWAVDTPTGDRTEAPPVGDWAWDQVSVSASACIGASNCPFGRECFSEMAREDAKASDIVVTNHALLAADMKVTSPLFGDFDAVIVDEVHEFEKALSSAWGADLSPASFMKTVKNAAKTAPRHEKVKSSAETSLEILGRVEQFLLDEMEPGAIKVLPEPLRAMLNDLNNQLLSGSAALGMAAEGTEGVKGGRMRAAAQTLEDAAETVLAVLDDSPDVVRWLESPPKFGPVVRTAPLEVGGKLQEFLGNRVLLATSATCSVGGTFDSLATALRFTDAFTTDEDGNQHSRAFKAVNVGSPFAWDTSAMLYIPSSEFPEPVGKDRTAHSEAVREELLELVNAAGGRTLFLSTTTAGARGAAEFLRARVPVNVYAHGDGTAGQLADWFADDETSVLCVTMGMWAGLNVPGASCSCVVIDKTPFPPMDDPLVVARSEAADARGGSGFMDVSVAHAGLLLAQGAGRLIRSSSDKGVIAVLDRRLLTKRYGQVLIDSLPPVRVFTDRDVVTGALTRLTGGMDAIGEVPGRSGDSRAAETSSRRGGAAAKSTGKSPSEGRKSPRGASSRGSKRSPWGKGAGAPVTATRKRKSVAQESSDDVNESGESG